MSQRLIVIGDAHGDLERMIQVFKSSGVINDHFEWIANPPNTYVIQMGDQIDSKNRTPDIEEWEFANDVALMDFMDKMDASARSHGGRVISLIGNHEIMNVLGEFSYVSETSLLNTGGKEARAKEFLVGGRYANILAHRYIVFKYGRYIFCHAGLLPSHLNIVGENIDEINNVYWKLMRTGRLDTDREKIILNEIIFGVNGLLWTRRYAELIGNPDALLTTLHIVLKTVKSTTMFIGHNTVPITSIGGNGALVFTDAMFSRAYGSKKFQYIDIRNDIMQVIEI
jgi:hypothetical protein